MLTTLDQVTPEWLTQVLRRNGHLDQGIVVSVQPRSQEFQGGPGFRPDHRLEVTYSVDASAAAPSRLYLKADSGSIHREAGKREVEFYTVIATTMSQSPGLPCYDAAYDEASGGYHLLLADVSDTHLTVEPEAPAAKADMEGMLATLARFHASWWGHPSLVKEREWVDAALINDEARLDFGSFVDYLGDRLSGKRRTIYERVLASLPRLLRERLRAEHGLTLVHDDAHVWNFLLPRNPHTHPVYLVDWQQWGVSIGLHDVAYMIGLFWYPERRARMEKELLRHYHTRLLEDGVRDYDWNACWQDYRLFNIRNLMVPLWAWDRAHRHGKYWGFHRWMQLEKAMLAFEDLECGELLSA